MRKLARFAVIAMAAVAVPLVSSPAWADEPATGPFGQHVRHCAQQGHLDGEHNPGKHEGAAGWDGMSCGG